MELDEAPPSSLPLVTPAAVTVSSPITTTTGPTTSTPPTIDPCSFYPPQPPSATPTNSTCLSPMRNWNPMKAYTSSVLMGLKLVYLTAGNTLLAYLLLPSLMVLINSGVTKSLKTSDEVVYDWCLVHAEAAFDPIPHGTQLRKPKGSLVKKTQFTVTRARVVTRSWFMVLPTNH